MAETIGVYVFLVLTSSTNQKISFSRIIELVKHLLSDLANLHPARLPIPALKSRHTT